MKGWAPRPRLTSRIHELGPCDAPTGQVAEDRNRDAMRTLWRGRGILAVDPEDVADDWTRQLLINLGDKLYGRRGRG